MRLFLIIVISLYLDSVQIVIDDRLLALILGLGIMIAILQDVQELIK